MFIEIGFENFTVRDLETAVREQVDVIPLMSQWLHLEDMGIRPFARMAIRAWWREILDAAMHPMSVLESIRQQEPAKAAVLDTPEGRMWFNATLYNLIMWLRAFGKIKGDRVLQPPPVMPERLIRRELPPPGV